MTVLVMLVWLDLLPTAMLQDVMMALLGWAAFSTLLVGSAGAWVAFARARAASRSRLHQRMPAHRN